MFNAFKIFAKELNENETCKFFKVGVITYGKVNKRKMDIKIYVNERTASY